MLDPKELFRFEPEILRDETGFLIAWNIPRDCPYFEGHFPNNPVLPAVGIIDATCEGVRTVGGRHKFSKIKSAKFSSMAGPNMKVQIHLCSTAATEWRARWYKENKDEKNVIADLTLLF